VSDERHRPTDDVDSFCARLSLVDGAVVERGKPHLVKDAAIQVYMPSRARTSSVSSAEQHVDRSSTNTFDRNRRQSWLDVSEYYSVAYYQYTRAPQQGRFMEIQCNLDEWPLTGTGSNGLTPLCETLDEHEDEDESPESMPHDTDHVLSTSANKCVNTHSHRRPNTRVFLRSDVGWSTDRRRPRRNPSRVRRTTTRVARRRASPACSTRHR
jgi:hypothetical protein